MARHGRRGCDDRGDERRKSGSKIKTPHSVIVHPHSCKNSRCCKKERHDNKIVTPRSGWCREVCLYNHVEPLYDLGRNPSQHSIQKPAAEGEILDGFSQSQKPMKESVCLSLVAVSSGNIRRADAKARTTNSRKSSGHL